MAARAEPSTLPLVHEQHSSVADNFSLTHGGPLYRLQLRLGAAEEQRIRVMRRALGAVLVAWLPLFLLSAAQGLAFGKHIPIPFILDFAVNVRFLIALPLLILSEVGIDHRLRITVNHFLKSGLVKEADLRSFEGVIEHVTRLRDRVLPEMVILVAAYLPSLSVHGSEILMSSVSSWHLVQTPSGETLSYAGWWFGLISVPVYRFLLDVPLVVLLVARFEAQPRSDSYPSRYGCRHRLPVGSTIEVRPHRLCLRCCGRRPDGQRHRVSRSHRWRTKVHHHRLLCGRHARPGGAAPAPGAYAASGQKTGTARVRSASDRLPAALAVSLRAADANASLRDIQRLARRVHILVYSAGLPQNEAARATP